MTDTGHDRTRVGDHNDPHAEHINTQIEGFRQQLLGMTLRNTLLSCPHGPSVAAQIRLVDELPDSIFQRLEAGESFAVLPLPEPRDAPDDEDTEEFDAALTTYKAESVTYRTALEQIERTTNNAHALDKLEREARNHVRLQLQLGEWMPERGLLPEDLARRHGIDPDYDLPTSTQEQAAERHYDNALQTLLDEDALMARLRHLRDRARSSVREIGVDTLFAAFGFVEWYEADESDRPYLAPLLLVPVELERRLKDGRYHYTLRGTDQRALANVTLAAYLRERYDLELPQFDADDSPESYFEKVTRVCEHRKRWQVRRFLTVGIFSYSKIAIYVDLDPDVWPAEAKISQHDAIRQLMAQSGVADIPFAEDREIDEDETTARTPVLIYDADSSQHSAVADVLSGGCMTIYGPPGTGKSQTITNIIAAAMSAGKSILFVAEKLTALEVVHDRLEKAGLVPFCFNLHAQGLRSGAVRRSLQERLYMERSSFNATTYQRQKEEWTKQRDALRTYARVMGSEVGRLDETVHDILWHAISRRASERNLPSGVATLTLSAPETLTAVEVSTTRQYVDRLVETYAAVAATVPKDQQPAWRGMRRPDLPPTEEGRALHLIAAWRDRIAAIDAVTGDLRVPVPGRCLGMLRNLCDGIEVLLCHAATIAEYNVALLGDAAMRGAVAAAHERAGRLQAIADQIHHLCVRDTTDLPESDAFRALASEARATDASDLSSVTLKDEANRLRRQATTARHTRDILDQLRALFEIDEDTPEVWETIAVAVSLLRESPRTTLLVRTPRLVEERAVMVLDRAEAHIDAIERARRALAERFDLGGLPSPEILRGAAHDLNRSVGPILLNARARQARVLHRSLAIKRSKVEPAVISEDLLRLADFAESNNRLADDTELQEYLGASWRGGETNIAPAREVACWAADVVARFAGIGAGRAQVRQTLLHGNIDVLDEILVQAGQLSEADGSLEAFSSPDTQPVDATELLRRAERLEALADRAASAGLTAQCALGQASAIAELIEDYRSLTAATEADQAVRGIFRGNSGEGLNDASLKRILALCTEIDMHQFDDDLWHFASSLVANRPTADAAGERQRLLDVLAEEESAWRDCSDLLEIDATEFCDGEPRTVVTLATLITRATECTRAGKALLPWSAYQRARLAVARSHAAPILTALEGANVSIDRLDEAYDWVLYRSLASAVYARYPELGVLSGGQLRNHKQSFHELEEKLQQLERERIAHTLLTRSVEHGVSFGRPGDLTELGLIQYQLSLQRSSVSPRDLLRRAGTALRQLKPCFMMSPTTVAELLPRDASLFDLAIIDEASQMLPSDALGAIARARQSVIVGDPKQLPPTSFFQGRAFATAGVDDDDGALARETESILDLALLAWRPPRHLRWHYRSRHSTLIQFSNARFYENQLLVFPGPDEGADDAGVKCHYIPDGVYKGSRNLIEAERVLQAACEFMENPVNRDLSLAVVAMNQPQRDLLDEMFDRETAETPAVARYRRRWENTLYPFVVKNLESIQGDERDVIFISTVYGPETPGGHVAQRFGPITHPGGERRLNVLFTRARRRIDVFSSMQAGDITVGPKTSEGIRILRDYLEYAATDRIETGTITGLATESPFEEHVRQQLVARGFIAEPQVGVAGYRIDLGVAHVDYPHGFVLGVECDGATYHSAKSVRDRDRLREAVLRDLGWDIYRIWSTDWFHDSETEMAKLIGYLEDRLAVWHGGRAVAVSDDALVGRLVEAETAAPSPIFASNRERSITVSTGDPNFTGRPELTLDDTIGTALSNDEDVVEVGDTVFYRRVGDDSSVRKVLIVSGVDDPDSGIINDAKPLAIALLGAAAGEHVTVRQPTGHIDIVVERIVRGTQGLDDDGAGVDGASEVEDGELAPYRSWDGHAPDPRTAKLADIADTLLKIIEVEGPVLVGRAYRVYARAANIQRVGRQVQRHLNRALGLLERQQRIAIERKSSSDGYVGAVVRLLTTSRVVVRNRGPRSFEEIPPLELASLIGRIKAVRPHDDINDTYREVLSQYGLTRMTSQVRAALDHAASLAT